MIEFLKITDENVFSEQLKSSRELFQENFNSTFQSKDFRSGLIPPGLIYSSNNASLIIFERPPTYKEIAFNSNNQQNAFETDDSIFIVPIPWQIYICQYAASGYLLSLQMFFATSEIKTIAISKEGKVDIRLLNDSNLLHPGLPNIYETMTFCLDKANTMIYEPSLENKVAVAYSAVWESTFNMDLPSGITQQIQHIRQLESFIHESHLSYFNFWEKKTLGDVVVGYEKAPFFRPIKNSVKLVEQLENNDQAAITFVSTLSALV